MKKSLVSAAAIASTLAAVAGLCPFETSIKARPPVNERKFRSEAVERKLVETKAKIPDPKLAEMFEKCFANPLDMAVTHVRDEKGVDDTWIIAGDLPDMWLRDSTTQALPYLPYMREDDGLRRMTGGLLRRQFKCVVIDPYANSFTLDPSKPSMWMSDMTEMKRELHERKYELDSLCYVLRLAGEYWRLTGDKAVFDGTWLQAMEKILAVMKTQQRKAGLKTEYRFQRKSANPVDSLPNAGYGHPAKPCGLIASAFRPSDDATVFPFLVPSNFMAVDTLRRAATVLEEANGELEMARACRDLAGEVSAALRKHAVVRHPKYGEVYAYEVDGYGGVLLGDDANAPSLLSLPYLAGVPKNDPIYLNTRRLVWSKDNPYFFTNGQYGGIGSPHTGIDMFWPLSCIIRALTTDNRSEIADSLEIIKKVDFGTGFIHEGVDMSDPGKYTRHWFGWANALFGELMVKLVDGGYFNPRWRGFNLGDLAILGEFEGRIRETDFQMIAELGFNFVRLPIDYRYFCDDRDPMKPDPEKLLRLDKILAWGRRYGVHVNLAYSTFPGMGLRPRTKDPLFKDPAVRETLADNWAFLARRYRGIPASELSFNLFNEPESDDDRLYGEIVRYCLKRLRAEDPFRQLFVDALEGARTLPKSLLGEDVGLSYHAYAPSGFTFYKAPWLQNGGKWEAPAWPPSPLSSPFNGSNQRAAVRGKQAFLNVPASTVAIDVGMTREAEVVAIADGKEIFRRMLKPEKDAIGYSDLHKQSDGRYVGVPEKPVEFQVPSSKRLEIGLDRGDWMRFVSITFYADGKRLRVPADFDWYRAGESRPDLSFVDFDHPLERADGKMMDGRTYLKEVAWDRWQQALDAGNPVMVGEFGVLCTVPHRQALAWMEDNLRIWKELGLGWALWNFRGEFGILDSKRKDVQYEDFHGHKLDRAMCELLQRY